jgi:hypothetical protein
MIPLFPGADVRADGDQVFGVPSETLESMIRFHIQVHHRVDRDFPIREIIVHDHHKRNAQFLE